MIPWWAHALSVAAVVGVVLLAGGTADQGRSAGAAGCVKWGLVGATGLEPEGWAR